MSYAQPLAALRAKVADAHATEALCSCFAFPNTTDLAEYFAKSAVRLTQGTLDLAEIQTAVEADVELTAFRARHDVLALLTAIEPLIDDLNLGRFDGLVVYRGGTNVLAVKFTANNAGRYAVVDVSDYRRSLETLASSTKGVVNMKNPIVMLGVLLVGAFGVAQVVTDLARIKL